MIAIGRSLLEGHEELTAVYGVQSTPYKALFFKFYTFISVRSDPDLHRSDFPVHYSPLPTTNSYSMSYSMYED